MVKIIWDWNGTLLDDVDLSYQCINRLLKSKGLSPIKSIQHYRDVFEFPVENYYKKIGFNFNKTPFSVLAQNYMDDYQDKSYTCSLYSDVNDTLKRARKYGFYQAVLSASHKDNLMNQIKNLDMESAFDSIWGIENIYATSKLDIAYELKKTCHFDDEIWLVGDSLHDYEVATRIGAHCILVSSGHQSKNKLLSKCDLVVDHLKESLDIIYERNKNKF